MEWELFRTICQASNEGDYKTFTTLVMENGNELDEVGWDMVLTAMVLTPDWMKEHADFCKWVYDNLDVQKYDLDWKTALRVEYFKQLYTQDSEG